MIMWLCFAVIGAFFYIIYSLNRWYRKPYIDNITSKRVFITGTDSGFGLNLALNLDKCGVKVYAGCFTEDGAKNLQKIASDRLKIIPIDITKVESVQRAKEEIEKDLGPDQELWGLVNNAGILPFGYLFPACTQEDYRQGMEVNFFGTMNVNDVFWPLIKKSAGRIVNMISMTGRASIGIEPYTCSKHALEPYSDGLRRWMKYFGVRVAIIEPGMFTSTNMMQVAMNERNINLCRARLSQDVKQEYNKELIDAIEQDMLKFVASPPLGRGNTTEMVANAMEHAILAKHPKDRYAVGLDAKFFYRSASILPDWFIDYMMELNLPSVHRELKKSLSMSTIRESTN